MPLGVLGDVLSVEGKHRKAAEHFRAAVDIFKKEESFDQRINAIELQGFLAGSIIRSGKAQEGIELAQTTFHQYDEGDGRVLREKDYYVWAVWKSGCATKMWNAILDKKVKLDPPTKGMLLEMLDEADRTTVFPDGQTTWGDRSFEMRKDEIGKIRQRLGIS